MTDEKKNAFTKDTIFSVTPAHLSKVNKITQAPPPIKPVSGLGLVRTSTNKPHEKQEVFIPVDGVELMLQWAVDWKCLFDLARQGFLIPDEPKHIQGCIENDFGMLSYYPPDEIEKYFSQWRYNPIIIEKFEAEHPKIIEAWQKKVKASDNKQQKQDVTETTPAPQTELDTDEFIKSITFSYLSDDEVRIRYNKSTKAYDKKHLGFQRLGAQKTWDAFIKVFKSDKYIYFTGKSGRHAYDLAQKNLKAINDKLISFFKKEYGVKFPAGFKLYDIAKTEGTGKYQFKFKMSGPRDVSDKYKDMARNELIATIEKLAEQLHDYYESGKDYNETYTNLSGAVTIALDKGFIGENRANAYLASPIPIGE